MSHIPFGYKVVKEKAYLDEEAAGKLRVLFEEYVKCGSMLAAAKTAGIEKTHSVIGRLLINEIYLGTDFYPQLIDRGLFEKAQKQRELMTKKRGRDNKPKKLREKKALFQDYESQPVKKKFSDPYEQAAFAYDQIKEVMDEE